MSRRAQSEAEKTAEDNREKGSEMGDWMNGGCHCGAVRFRVRATKRELLDCNCSMCARKGNLHLIVEREDFELVHGEEQLVTYTFGTHLAKHRFCRVCGIHPFYLARSHPDGIDVNARCLDVVIESGLEGWAVTPFDGRNWEENVASIQ